MHKKSPLIALVLFTNALSQTTFADGLAATQLTENDFFSDIPVVLTATRLKQSKKNSPIATTIIDRRMIEASGFTEIADLLRLAPGMLVNYDSGHIASVGYQFLFDRYRVRLQVLVDGKSVYTPAFGEMPWTQLGITVDDIERIEVIRGPSSASYGPNAMTGVISIITRHAALDKGMRFKLNHGINGRSEQFATIGSSSGKFDYTLSFAKRKDDGFNKRHDSKNLTIANFRGDYQITNNDIITFDLNHSSGHYQEDAVDSLNPGMPDHTKVVSQSSFQSKWEHNYADGDIFSLNYYQQTYTDKNNYILNDATYGLVPLNESVTTDRKNLEVTYTTASDFYNLTLGALYRQDKTLAPEYLYQVNRDIITQQVFLNSELYLNNSNILNIGVLHDENDTAGTSTSPRIALNHHFNRHHTARISYSESSRSPFAIEEYTNRVIEVPLPLPSTSYTVWKDLSDLKAEKIKSFDLGYIGNFNNNATNIEARIYKNWLTDLIVQDWALFTGGFLQGDAFNVTGFEATLSHKINNSKIILNYARTEIEPVTLTYGSAVSYKTGAPEDSVSLLIMHNFGKNINGSLGYYYTGSYQQLCCEVQQQAPRNRIDITLSKKFKIDGHNSKINFVLQNITNEKVNTILFNNYDRQGYVSFSIEL